MGHGELPGDGQLDYVVRLLSLAEARTYPPLCTPALVRGGCYSVAPNGVLWRALTLVGIAWPGRECRRDSWGETGPGDKRSDSHNETTMAERVQEGQRQGLTAPEASTPVGGGGDVVEEAHHCCGRGERRDHGPLRAARSLANGAPAGARQSRAVRPRTS
jgi:hypothetical protein